MEKKEAKLEYPRKWGFTVIGRDKEKIEQAIKEVLGEKEHNCKFSKTSKNGKFNSYNAECTVESEEERDKLYKAFGDHDDVDYVL
jgi:putative lipoic acid-binding regulatory protein